MKTKKNQTQRILDGFVTSVILIVAVTLVASGIAISKINTDYMETGVRAGKIVAERKAQQISITTHDGLTLTSETNPGMITDYLAYLPPPVNTTYILIEDIISLIENYRK
ncbi:MAG: hypothetical protein J6L62_09755 [Clostridia bacterium]|nr:hypothetical protein [Clostridia bacterium]